MVVTIFLLGCLILVFWAGGRNNRFLYLAGFLIPLRSIAVDYFVGFTWMLVIVPLAIAAIVVHKKRGPWHGKIDTRWIVALFAYATVVTVIRALLDYTSVSPRYVQAATFGWGPAQSTYRYPVQFLSYAFTWGVILVGFWFTQERRDVVALIKGYIGGNLANALIGLYQILAYQFGLPWLTELQTRSRGEELAAAAARAQLKGLDISGTLYRLSGIGGEPKHSASSLVIALTLILCLGLFPQEGNQISHSRLKFAIMILALYLTFSSGGWLSTILVGAYFVITALLRRRASFIGYAALVLLILAVFVFAYGGVGSLGAVYENRISSRLMGGLDTLRLYEPKDTAVVQYALQHPLDMILGHGTGGIDFWTMTDPSLSFWVWGRTGTVTPAYLPTRLLGDLGLVGIVLVGMLLWQWYKKLKEAGLTAYSQFLVAGGLGLLVASQQSLPGYLLICASMVAYACRSEQRSSEHRTLPVKPSPVQWAGQIYTKKARQVYER